MSEVLSGANWEIIKNFINPDTARIAGEQALDLVLNKDVFSYVREVTRQNAGQEGFEVFGINSHDFDRYPSYPNTITGDHDIVEASQELLMLNRRVSRFLGTSPNSFYINLYDAMGHTRSHRDRYMRDNMAVSLLGVAEAQITDYATGMRHKFIMEPGDAMYLINPRPQRFRPLHKVINVDHALRLSFVK